MLQSRYCPSYPSRHPGSSNIVWKGRPVRTRGHSSSLQGHSLTLVGSKLYLYGGSTKDGFYSPDLYVMDTGNGHFILHCKHSLLLMPGAKTTLASQLKSALLGGDFSDLVFSFPHEDVQLLRCHKSILCTRSAKFRGLIQGKGTLK